MRHHRSMDGSLDGQKQDPTLTLPHRNFPRGINRTPADQLPYALRPGPETRSNSANETAITIAMQKHGEKRLANKMEPPLHQDAIERIMNPDMIGERPRTREEAEQIVNTRKLSGGWENPRSSKSISVKVHAKPWKGEDRDTPYTETMKPVVAQAKSLVSKITWNVRTKIVTEARGAETGYAHRQFNPDGEILTYVGPTGRGVRYDQLNTDHVASSVDHQGNKVESSAGKDIRTLRGFTNPTPFSKQGFEAEDHRLRLDKSRQNGVEIKSLISKQPRNRAENIKPSAIKAEVKKPKENIDKKSGTKDKE